MVRDAATIDVVLAGDLDMAGALQLEPELDRLLGAPGVRTVVLDLAGVGFSDSDRTGSASLSQRPSDAVEG